MTNLGDSSDFSMDRVVIFGESIEVTVFDNECGDVHHQSRRSSLVCLRWCLSVYCSQTFQTRLHQQDLRITATYLRTP